MKPLNGPRRVGLWGSLLAALLLTAAFMLAAPPVDGTAVPSSVDLSAPASGVNCAPCHATLDPVEVQGLYFTHGSHLLVPCGGCHLRPPHVDGGTGRVPMEACFSCHGVEHGPQGELVSGDCPDCHSPTHELRPETHSKTWAEIPHADEAESEGVNGCMMCHDAPKDCDECHRDEEVDIEPIPNVYHSVVASPTSMPSYEIYPDGGVSASQCMHCHPDLDAISPERLVFAHDVHLERNYRCESCHPEFAHSPKGTVIPDMLSCYRCHDSYHSDGGEIADGKDCAQCHPKSFDLRPSDHTKSFAEKTHNKTADSSPESCSMCHDSEFCVDCHSGRGTTPNAPSKPVLPDDHKEPDWRVIHGELYLRGEEECGICHEGPSCQRCHQTVVPHPPGWANNHEPAEGIDNADCNVCHTERSECQQCHHSSVKSAELVAKNCVKCHPEMKTKPATSIKNTGLAEHAVHFDVVKTKGKPYVCDDCHISVGRVGITIQSGPTGPHDLRICYDCHGSLDMNNVMIAPWPGSELCRRCHADLKL